MNTTKNILISAVVSAVIAFLVVFVGGLVGNQSAFLGEISGITRMPNSGMAMHFLKLTNSPGTSTAIADASLLVNGTSSFSGALTISGVATFSNTISNTAATSTLGCLRVYQTGATTVASTTYYLMASTTVWKDGYYIFATTTKPTYCE